MFIIVTRLPNLQAERVNMALARKYRDHEIKFANDHIIRVQETSSELDLLVWASYYLKSPVSLTEAKKLFNEIKTKEVK